MVDNSSKWRMADDVPLVVSEVNPEALDGHRGIVADNLRKGAATNTVQLAELLHERGLVGVPA